MTDAVFSATIIGMLLAIVSIALTALAYIIKRATLAIGAAFSWLLFALQGYSSSTTTWDIYYCMFWFGIAMMLAIAIESVQMRIWTSFGNSGEKETKEQEVKRQKKEAPETMVVHISPTDKLRAKHGLPPSKARDDAALRAQKRKFFGD